MATFAALLALAAWLAGVQSVPVAWMPPSSARAIAALVLGVAYIGSCIALARRRAAPPARDAADAANTTDAAVTDAPPRWRVLHASQTGFAEALARRTADALAQDGAGIDVRPLGRATLADLSGDVPVLFVVSTTGEGDAPDSALAFTRSVLAADADLSRLRYGLLALGDREYAHFCRFGRELDAWLRRHGAQALFDAVEVDDGDAAALRHWQHHLSLLTGHDQPDWQPPSYQPWRLAARTLLNPGSIGGECHHLVLVPPSPAECRWQAGDILEVGPRNDPHEVDAFLAALQLDGGTVMGAGDASASLATLLAARVLGDPAAVAGCTPDQLLARLPPLPHREYSIASVPEDGAVELVVRLMPRADGQPGLGSGWLTRHAPVGSTIDARVRVNAGFHAPAADVPLILVGNGTGIAGLRAHIKARVAAGARRNWLLFGERNAAHDFLFRDELAQWQRDGWLAQFDAVFSRDQPQRRYVQDRLRERLPDVREWLDAGAAVYVCGSLAGMAPGVHAALVEAVGEDRLLALAAEGRYRRDVY